jgi:hypothetical protein
MAKRICYDAVGYGEWIRPRMRNFREQCCDCGLIHRLNFRIVDDNEGARPPTKGRQHPRLHIEIRTRRDDRATAAARRSFKFTPDE